MMNITLGGKEYQLKFAYRPTVMSAITSRIVALDEENPVKTIADAMTRNEKVLAVLPELLLVALQKYHRDEFGYNYETGEGKDTHIETLCDLLDTEICDNGLNAGGLYDDLCNEMLTESFLSNALRGVAQTAEARKKKSKVEKN